MDKLEKAKKERTKVSDGRMSWWEGQVCGVSFPSPHLRGASQLLPFGFLGSCGLLHCNPPPTAPVPLTAAVLSSLA